MPLRFLLGEGEPSLLELCFSTIRPEQVVMCGLRVLDGPEEDFINEYGVACLSVDAIQEDVGAVSRMVAAKGYRNVYIHIDLDVLDSEKCPWALCKTPDGMDTGTLMALLAEIRSRLNVAGISVVELRPVDGMDLKPLKALVRACEDIL